MLFLSSLHHFSFPRQRGRSQQGMVGLTWRPRRSLRSWKETSKCWRWEHPWILRGSTRRTTEMAFPNTFRSVELSPCFLVLYTCGYQYWFCKSWRALREYTINISACAECDVFLCVLQVGTVVDNAADFYHSRIPKKERKRTIVEELLADAEFRQ